MKKIIFTCLFITLYINVLAQTTAKEYRYIDEMEYLSPNIKKILNERILGKYTNEIGTNYTISKWFRANNKLACISISINKKDEEIADYIVIPIGNDINLKSKFYNKIENLNNQERHILLIIVMQELTKY